MSAAPEAIPRRGVDIPAIEAELRAMWRESEATTRACMGNLVVVCSDDADLARATAAVARITAAIPCRVLALCAERGETRGPDAWISAHCRFAPGSQKTICCEQITLRAGGEAVFQLPSAVLSLLLSDLPVSLWWRGPPPRADDRLTQRMAAIADLCIVDSGAAPGPLALTGLAGLLAEPRRPGFSDLAWHRIASWQEQAARFFDPPERREHPLRLDRVLVAHAPTAGGEASAEALLVVGWLGARLDWRPAGKGRVRAPDGPVEIQIAGRERRDVSPGEIVAMQLSARRAATPVVVTLTRDEAPGYLRAKEDTSSACGLPRLVRLDALDESALVTRALQGPKRDPLYESSVRFAAALLSAP